MASSNDFVNFKSKSKFKSKFVNSSMALYSASQWSGRPSPISWDRRRGPCSLTVRMMIWTPKKFTADWQRPCLAKAWLMMYPTRWVNPSLSHRICKLHDDFIKWKHFLCYWDLVRGIRVNPLSQRPVMRSFDVFFDLRLNKCLSKQPRRQWFQMSSRSLWRNCNGFVLFWFGYVCSLMRHLVIYLSTFLHWNENVFILMKFLSLSALKVVNLTVQQLANISSKWQRDRFSVSID